MADKQQVGKILHFYPKISVAVIELTGDLKQGDKINIKGNENEVDMMIESMQIEHNPVEEAKAGQAIGLKTPEPVKEKDVVFKVVE